MNSLHAGHSSHEGHAGESSPQQVTVLGSTGSIGQNTLDVLAKHPARFSVFALSAHTQVDALLAQCIAFSPAFAVMASPAHAQELSRRLDLMGSSTRVLSGPQGLVEIAKDERVHIVMAAIVGAAGLPPCVAAAQSGKRLLLANKEALVMGGGLFMRAVQEGGATLLPIDSEHSAIFQALPVDRSQWPQMVRRLILTASGGPFRTRSLDTFGAITPEQACAHPNWVMGRKISVDSATMMNKALEVIEAHELFGLPLDRIEVLIHPQSVIHSMVEYVDTSVLAQMGTPDMRVPISYGLAWPSRMNGSAQALNFTQAARLDFEPVDPERFPLLSLAWQALRGPLGTSTILNAANEVAVQAFLDRRIGFLDIARVNRSALDTCQCPCVNSWDALYALDAQIRHWAQTQVNRLAI
jgi:1-deoxy-D-xylulose-5-phosphate reductoisomerase